MKQLIPTKWLPWIGIPLVLWGAFMVHYGLGAIFAGAFLFVLGVWGTE